MKPIILTLAILALLAINTNAQNFTKYFNRGVELYDSSKYYLAYKQFDASRKVAVVEKNTANINTAQTWIDKAVSGIEAKMRASDSLAIVASEEKEKALAALTKAELMQTKVETAMFDKAVKERNSEWKGYANYTSETDRAEILDIIDTLNLSENALLRIPKEVAECPNLKHINLLGNDDIDWNASTETLSKLSSEVGIYVSVYDLDSIPSEYWSMVTGIEMLTCCLNSIPENILLQTQLTYLDLSGNIITLISKEIGNLINLIELNLGSNQLKILPNEIGNLTNLKSFDLSWNHLTELPKEIGQLISLKELKLFFNQLTEVPKEIGNLKNLEYICLYENDKLNIASVFIAFKNFNKTIVVANLFNNFKIGDYNLLIILPKLTELPKEIGELTNLTSLNLNYNKLTKIPNEIGELINLTSLNLESNELNEIPKEIGKLTNLTSLNLDVTELNEIPKEIGKLTNLTYLSLSGNQLTEIPKEIGKLTNLTYLGLSGNQLTEVPKEIGKLTNLTRLNLGYNQLTEIPKEIGKLTNLTELYLGRNQLTEVQKEIIKLDNLITLNLDVNPIKEEEINNLNKILPNCKIEFESYHEYYFNNYEYKKVTDYYLININDTTGLSLEDKEIYAKSFNYEGVKFDNNVQSDSALLYYKLATIIKPDFFWGWYNLGISYLNENYNDSIIICYTKAIKIDSTYADAWYGLGNSYGVLKQFELMELNLRKSIELGNIDAWNSLSFYYNRWGKYDMAIGCADTSLIVDPTTYNPIAHKAYSLLKKGDLENAKLNLEKIQKLMPKYNKMFFYWACYYAVIGETENALTNLQIAIDNGFTDLDWIEEEISFDSLRTNESFISIVNQLIE